MNFANCPPEVFECILSFVDVRTLNAFILVSKEFALFGYSDRLWRLLLSTRWPTIDWQWRAQHLQDRLGVSVDKPLHRILYAQQLSLERPGRAKFDVKINSLKSYIAGQQNFGDPLSFFHYTRFKIALLGDRQCGKSSLALNMCRRSAVDRIHRRQNYGGQLWSTSCKPTSVPGLMLHLQIWEANSDSVDSIYQALSKCQAVLLTYDTSNRLSFESLSSKWTSFLTAVGSPIIVVGLKLDLESQVHESEDLEFCNTYKFRPVQRNLIDGSTAQQILRMIAAVSYRLSK